MKQDFTLDFNNEYDRSYNNYREIFKRLNKKTFDYLQIEENYLIEVNLVDSGEIQHINKTFRGIDAPTDVISFALLDEVEGESPLISDKNTPRLLGAIMIAVDVALEQAKKYNHSPMRELKFLYLHGLLHLLGYDHDTTENEQQMNKIQNEILGKRKENHDDK
ncbi:MAG: rRNA maturation RNase YbeY [Erysipelotrichaceae bacterium]|nr:rRNA maturation RNase YbeY [Erysipelotrichaceae bacterium]